MLGALTQRHGQFMIGKYLGTRPDNVVDAPFFTYESVKEKEKRYNQLVQNLITHETSVIIKTNYVYKWKNQAFVLLQDGKKYIITNLQELEEEINAQAMATVRNGSDVIYYLELIEADESDG